MLHIRCFEIHSVDSTLYGTLQYGPITIPAATKKERPQEGYGVRLLLSRRGARKGSVEHVYGYACLNFGGELIRIPEGAELTDSELKQLETEIKELIS